MNDFFVIVKVDQSLSDLFHDCFALVMLKFANFMRQIAIRAVLKDYSQEPLLSIEEELAGFQDVGMVQFDVHFGLF